MVRRAMGKTDASVLGRRKGKCKDLEAQMSLMCLQNSKRFSVASTMVSTGKSSKR